MPSKFLRWFTKRVFIICNVAVALFFLMGCYGGRFNPGSFWFTGYFTLAAFYLFVLLLGFIVFWLLTKPRLVLISIIAIAFAWKPLGHLVRFRISSDFVLVKDAGNLRVMSWNVEHFDILEHKTHPERKQEMINIINQHQPDIACFEEMVGAENSPSAINYIPKFLEQLNFNNYFYSYNPKLDFDNNHHFGVIIFSKYPIINKQTVSYAPNDYNSIFQYIDIVKGTDTFRVFNIHLQSLRFSRNNLHYIEEPSITNTDLEEPKNILAKIKYGFLKRQVQSERIRKAMDESPYPLIVCGDFNDVPNSYAYNTIGKGMKNTFAEKGSGIGRTFFNISPTLRIDNIFADERFDVQQYTCIKKKLSDHFPIITDLYFKKP